jgi:hypothetical protein
LHLLHGGRHRIRVRRSDIFFVFSSLVLIQDKHGSYLLNDDYTLWHEVMTSKR